MDIFSTSSQKDYDLIRKAWGEIFGNQHPMVLKIFLMNWFYKPSFGLLSSGFRYSVNDKQDVSAFIGYRTIKWSKEEEEIWICGFGADSSKPGVGFLLLKDFLKIHSEKTICVVGFIPELERLYISMGFVIKEGYRNVAKVTNNCINIPSFELLTAKDFFSNYSHLVSQQFRDSYNELFTGHIAWEYFVLVGYKIAFFVRKEAGLICRIVMAYDISNKDFSKLTSEVVNELYFNIAEYFNYEYIDFICNIDFSVGLNGPGISLMGDIQLPGYFCPKAPYKSLRFAVKNTDNFKRNIYFKADGDQERSNG